jgi:hypothetical protein
MYMDYSLGHMCTVIVCLCLYCKVKLIFVSSNQYFEVATLRVNVSSVIQTVGSVKYDVCVKNSYKAVSRVTQMLCFKLGSC